ncbi:MAG: hypothetical protein WCJ45_01860 [bacterium]
MKKTAHKHEKGAEKYISGINTVRELIRATNSQLEDTLYIADEVFIPAKKNIARCYRSDFTLKTKKEAEALAEEHKITISDKLTKSDFFVYNEKTGELVPFKKNDYLMYDRGYFTFDGSDYFSYDDNGKEI